MSVSNYISRATDYYRRRGFRATIHRARVALSRELFANGMIVFYCEPAKQTAAPANSPSFLRVERLKNYAELSPQDLQTMTSFWNPKQAHRNIRERFANGAFLWLIKLDNQLAGFSWTIRGRSISTYYFPLTEDDVQLFDFYVFPKFRGRAILWFLISDVLQNLRAEGVTRVFGDAAEWNQPSLSFYRMTPFRPLGFVRTYKIFGRTFNCWAGSALGLEQKGTARSGMAMKILGSSE